MLAWVQITALLGLEKLRPDREGRATPPEAAEYVGRSGLLIEPALRRDVGPPLRQVKAILALLGDCPIPLKADGPRITRVVPVFARRLQRKTPDGMTERSPSRLGPRRPRSAVCWLRE